MRVEPLFWKIFGEAALYSRFLRGYGHMLHLNGHIHHPHLSYTRRNLQYVGLLTVSHLIRHLALTLVPPHLHGAVLIVEVALGAVILVVAGPTADTDY